MLVVTIATIVGTVSLYFDIPKGFFPIEDTGFIFGTVEGPSDISFMADVRTPAEDRRDRAPDPAVDYVNSTVGVGGPNLANNQGRLFIALKPRGERKEKLLDVIQRLRRDANVVTGMARLLSGAEHQHRGQNLEERITSTRCNRAIPTRSIGSGRRCATRSPRFRACVDVTERSLCHQSADDDRDRSRDGGGLRHLDRSGPPGAVRRFGARQVATIYTPSNDYQVILETKPEFQVDATGLSQIYRQDQRTGAATALGRRGRRQRRGVPAGRRSRFGGRRQARCPPSVRCRSITRASSRR